VTLGVLAAASSASDNVEPGVLGFLVVAGIGVVLVFLLRSMNKQFRKITPVPGPATENADGAEDAEGEPAKAPAQTPE
jgi:hypothetical protein